MKILKEIGLLLLSAVLFSLAFPSFISDWGFPPLAFICLVPLFVVIRSCSWKMSPLYGIIFGYVSYALFNYWLSTFHPLAIVIVPVIYASYFLVLLPVLKLAYTVFPRCGYLVQAGLWLAYEYLRTLGFLGYPYGNLGYSQYLFRPFIQISSVTGFWLVSLMVVFPSVYIGNAIAEGRGIKPFFKKHRFGAAAYATVFAAMLIFGFAADSDYSDIRQIKLGFVQHNADTWKGGIRAYERNMNKLIELSEKALAEDPDIEMMVWSETCFVPGIDWHTRYRTDPERYRLVKELTDYFHTKNIPYVIGNDDGRLEPGENGQLERVDYNAVLLYDQKELKQTYRKTHLVPFTENFPYKKQMPRFYQLLVDKGYHFWKKGTEYTVFNAAGIRFSTPICYEDVFGYISREFVQSGAQIIVNMTNDSWSGSVAAEMQHMAMAVFRAVENRRTVVRGTNSGITCTIEPDGEITAMLEPFTEDYLINSVPVYEGENTLYTRFGDWFAILNLVAVLTVMVFGSIYRLFRRSR